MPRAYIETIFSSKPGNRRWYLAINCELTLKQASFMNDIQASMESAICLLVLSGQDWKRETGGREYFLQANGRRDASDRYAIELVNRQMKSVSKEVLKLSPCRRSPMSQEYRLAC